MVLREPPTRTGEDGGGATGKPPTMPPTTPAGASAASFVWDLSASVRNGPTRATRTAAVGRSLTTSTLIETGWNPGMRVRISYTPAVTFSKRNLPLTSVTVVRSTRAPTRRSTVAPATALPVSSTTTPVRTPAVDGFATCKEPTAIR